jgi:2-iminobutanoate/2-iminopropanoate deaminase
MTLKPTLKSLLVPICAALLAVPLLAEKKAITPPEFAASPCGTGLPFSPGMLVDGTLYIAGQIGRDPKTNEVPADFEQEVKRRLDNVGIVLKAAGMTFSDAVSVSVYLTDMELFARMNTVYAKYFPDPRPPGRRWASQSWRPPTPIWKSPSPPENRRTYSAGAASANEIRLITFCTDATYSGLRLYVCNFSTTLFPR